MEETGSQNKTLKKNIMGWGGEGEGCSFPPARE